MQNGYKERERHGQGTVTHLAGVICRCSCRPNGRSGTEQNRSGDSVAREGLFASLFSLLLLIRILEFIWFIGLVLSLLLFAESERLVTGDDRGVGAVREEAQGREGMAGKSTSNS